MSDDFETESEDSFGKELAKNVTLSAAGAVAMVVGLYAGGLIVGQLKVLKDKRSAKKADPEPTVWEAD